MIRIALCYRSRTFNVLFFVLGSIVAIPLHADDGFPLPPPEGTIRIATYNVSLNRREAGQLQKDLAGSDVQAIELAKIIQTVQPDLMLINEIDFDSEKQNAQRFLDGYLNVQGPLKGSKATAKRWSDWYAGPVNTGIASGLDLNQNGKLKEPDDCWGFGAYPGQYGMAIYSRFPIQKEAIRTFQHLKWSSMPKALQPFKSNGDPFWPESIWKELRLSSKSHWDVPIETEYGLLHLLASHPTPPVFDGDEDRNGCRNHDEIRFWNDYLSGGPAASYIVDDQGRSGGSNDEDPFVVVGDLNSDPVDGAGRPSAILGLLQHVRIAKSPTPISPGGEFATKDQGQANNQHRAPPSQDTADFQDQSSGNLRCDFVLPSSNLQVVASGIFWPTPEQCRTMNLQSIDVSDHRMVWVDVRFPK